MLQSGVSHAELAGDGLTIKAPPNPLRGVTVEDAGYMQCVIEQVEGPVLLVGHSYGGAVITAAGVTDNPRGDALTPSGRR